MCNTCGVFPDGISVLAWVNDWTAVAAKNAVAAYLGMDRSHDVPALRPAAPIASAKPPVDAAEKAAKLERLWANARHGDARLVTYLRSRGLSVDPPPSLRLHAALQYWDGMPPRQIATVPAMLARVQDPAGRLVGLHRTFLQPDGSGKLRLFRDGRELPAKKLSSIAPGSTNRGAIQLFPPAPSLALAEGVETALAVFQATGLPVWACVSAGGLERVFLPPEVREVTIMADADASGVGERAARSLARRLVDEGCSVKVVVPPIPGCDWLDVLRGEVDHG